ncbi:MAG: dockerin type I repeat-containing protein [Clostridia bacterium]|nr:dockerin type I repeat-containing protein [Clostridia bacterium]
MKKRILSSLIAVAMLASTAIITAYAERTPLFIGDVTQDHHVNMDDVVTLQRYIAEITEISKRGLVAADVNNDGDINMEDVTLLQQKIAEIIHTFGRDDILGTYVEATSITASVLSGKAIAGESVKFTVEEARGYAPLTFEFFVNDVMVREREEARSFEYKFDKAGDYKITAKVYNGFDETREESLYFKVVESLDSDKPLVKSLDFDNAVIFEKRYDEGEVIRIYTSDENIKITANASMGTEPYEYMFLLDGKKLTDDYSTTNSVSISTDRPSPTICILTVKIKDKNGIESSEDFKLYFTERPIA